jgi:hypothetical protein
MKTKLAIVMAVVGLFVIGHLTMGSAAFGWGCINYDNYVCHAGVNYSWCYDSNGNEGGSREMGWEVYSGPGVCASFVWE